MNVLCSEMQNARPVKLLRNYIFDYQFYTERLIDILLKKDVIHTNSGNKATTTMRLESSSSQPSPSLHFAWKRTLYFGTVWILRCVGTETLSLSLLCLCSPR